MSSPRCAARRTASEAGESMARVRPAGRRAQHHRAGRRTAHGPPRASDASDSAVLAWFGGAGAIYSAAFRPGRAGRAAFGSRPPTPTGYDPVREAACCSRIGSRYPIQELVRALFGASTCVAACRASSAEVRLPRRVPPAALRSRHTREQCAVLACTRPCCFCWSHRGLCLATASVERASYGLSIA